ncbi:MAG: hypothetical protein QXX12_00020 [Nanopusillaceae archaeon]
MFSIQVRSGGQWVQLAPIDLAPGTPFSQIRFAVLDEFRRKELMPAFVRFRTVNYAPSVGQEVLVRLAWIYPPTGATHYTPVFYGHVTSVQRVQAGASALPSYEVEAASALRVLSNSIVELELENVSLNTVLAEAVAHCLNPSGSSWYETGYGFRCRAGSAPPFSVSVLQRPFNAHMRATGRFVGRLGDLLDSLYLSLGQYVNEEFLVSGDDVSVRLVMMRAFDPDGYGFDYTEHGSYGSPPPFIRSIGASSFRIAVRTVEVFSAPTRVVKDATVSDCGGTPCVQLDHICYGSPIIYLLEGGQEVATLCEGSADSVCDYYVDRSGDESGASRIVFGQHMLGRPVRIHYDAVKKVSLRRSFGASGIADSRVLSGYDTADSLLPDYPSGAVLNMNDSATEQYVMSSDLFLYVLSVMVEPSAVGESLATYYGEPFKAYAVVDPGAGTYEELHGAFVGLRLHEGGGASDGQVNEVEFDGRAVRFTIKPTLMDDVLSAIKKLTAEQAAMMVTLARSLTRPRTRGPLQPV